jgi:membrane protein DedA with SNARE-associated domain
MCFVGRFIVGVRAAMCMTAGATRFPYWRFFLADFCGALLSIPFFVVLGYLCADMIPKLLGDLRSAQTLLTAAAIGVVAALLLVYTVRKRRRARRIGARREAALAAESRTARGA